MNASPAACLNHELRPLLCLALLMSLGFPTAAQPTSGNVSTAKPAQRESKTVVVMGDSLAAGYGLDPSLAFPALIQKLIDEQGWHFTVVNAGVSGDTSAGGSRRIDWLLKRRVDVLVLELGGNDGLRGLPVAVTRSNLQAIIDRTRKKYPQARVVIAGMQMPPNYGPDYAKRFADTYVAVARKAKVPLVPFLLKDVADVPNASRMFQNDGLHPTAAAHPTMLNNVWPSVKKLMAWS